MQLQQAESDREELRKELQEEKEARQSLESVVKELQVQLSLQADSCPPGDCRDTNTNKHRHTTQVSDGS